MQLYVHKYFLPKKTIYLVPISLKINLLRQISTFLCKLTSIDVILPKAIIHQHTSGCKFMEYQQLHKRQCSMSKTKSLQCK